MTSVLSWVNKQVANAQSAVKQAVQQEEIPINGSRVRILKELGSGGYAFVYLVEDIHTGKKYALKKMTAGDSETKQVAKMEIKIMRSYKKAPNLVRYYNSCMKQIPGRRMTEYYILMELCSRGALLDEITERIEHDRYYSERQIIRMFRQTCVAVKWFHTRKPPIQHRDLKIENLLVTADGTLKLCDFGSCTQISKKYTTRSEILQEEERIQKYTTNCYMAPEMADLYKHEVISEKVDIWALGCILFVMAFFEHPFQEKGTLAIMNCAYTIPSKHKYSTVLLDMIKNLLTAKPKRRPDIHKCLDMVDAWERFLDTGKKPDFKSLGRKQQHPVSGSEESDEDSEDIEERKKRKAAKKHKKKMEKKKKREMEKKAKESQRRAMEAAARRQARRKLRQQGGGRGPAAPAEDDFDVDWSKQGGGFNCGGGSAGVAASNAADEAAAEFDVDWDNGLNETQQQQGREGEGSSSSSKLSWDPFAADNTNKNAPGGDIFSVLESSSGNDPNKIKPTLSRALSGGGGGGGRAGNFDEKQQQQQQHFMPPQSAQLHYVQQRQISGQSPQMSPNGMIMPQQQQQQWGGGGLNHAYMMQQQQQYYHQQQQQQMYNMQQQQYQQQLSSPPAPQRQGSSNSTVDSFFGPGGGVSAATTTTTTTTRGGGGGGHGSSSVDAVSGLTSAFSGVGMGSSQVRNTSNVASNSTFASDPFAGVGFNDHTPKERPKSGTIKEKKEKDVFECLGEFTGF
mmetsp:Transcript_41798/g.67883  ORF Transcript_41798/g.67883 Transcript_41798/m.67883 type:complete len:737 (-) Transcript_41798:167-2377(-)